MALLYNKVERGNPLDKTAPKKLLTIAIVLCLAVIYVQAQNTPPHAATTQTWTIGNTIWSDAIYMPACNNQQFPDSRNKAQCVRDSTNTYTYYNWWYVSENKQLLCPSPWHVPEIDDIKAINVIPIDIMVGEWKLAGSARQHTVLNMEEMGCYWTATEFAPSEAYKIYTIQLFTLQLATLQFATYVPVDTKFTGCRVRCIRKNAGM
jgi:hypothetical protein